MKKEERINRIEIQARNDALYWQRRIIQENYCSQQNMKVAQLDLPDEVLFYPGDTNLQIICQSEEEARNIRELISDTLEIRVWDKVIDPGSDDEPKWYWQASIPIPDFPALYYRYNVIISPASPNTECAPEQITHTYKSWACKMK